MFTLQAQTRFTELDRLVDQLLQVVAGAPVPQAIQGEYRVNFARQGSGSGGWAPLKPATIADRRRRGYGAGPILQRTGEYMRSFTDGDTNVRSEGDSVVFEAGSQHKLVDILNNGAGAIPARPVDDFDAAQVDRLYAAIDTALARL